MIDRDKPIGVFDSGVGGVSVLAEMARIMPSERFLYYGDSKNAPYGTKTEREILALSVSAAEVLLARGIKELVVACNTATSAAVKTLRERLAIPVIGTEPAVKPASAAVGEGRMLVMATPATIRQEKLASLVSRYGKNAELLPCEGLMEFAERLETDSPALDEYLQRLFSPYRGEKIDAAVLGCTHYSFLRAAIERALPGVPIFDGKEGVARQARRVLINAGANRLGGEGGIEFFTSGDESEQIPRMRALYKAASDR